MRLTLQILLILLIVSTFSICAIQPDLHKNVIVYDSDYTLVPEQEVTTETKNIYPKTEPYPNDSVELSKKDEQKKKPSLVKTLLAIGGGIAGAGAMFCGAVILMANHHGNKIAKLYKEKLVLSNLPEKIEFKEAKTVQEGIDFAKKILGIKEVDKDITLEAINTANKGLVDVSNANKGKLFIPTRLGFETPNNKDDDYIAYVVKDIYSNKFGNLVVNKNYFDGKFLDNEINKFLFFDSGNAVYKISDDLKQISSTQRIGCVRPFPNDDIARLIKDFYKDSSKLNISDKQKLYYSLEKAYISATRAIRNPLEALKTLSEKKAEFLKNNNIEINFAELEKMNTEKQVEYLKNLIQKMEDKNSYWQVRFGVELPTSTIHHEMGHLQDFAKNLKELDIKKWKFSFREAWREAGHKVKTGEDISRVGVKEVDNRWGSTWKDKYEKLLKENPEKFKKYYPDLYEFVTKQDIQQTVGKISGYAQSGIGEFIAEVYAKMIEGKTIPEDVMALYRKYKGPELPA